MTSSGCTRIVSDEATHHQRHSVDVHRDAFFELKQEDLVKSVNETLSSDVARASEGDNASLVTDVR